MKNNEIMVVINSGWLYFRTTAANAEAALKELRQELEYAGIDDSNVEYGNLEVRDANGQTIDSLKTIPETRYYDCNHDCDALYEAYEKGKRDAINVMKKILEAANV